MHAWQFAADGVWEEALCIDTQQPIDIKNVTQWVSQKPQNVALEAIFAEAGTPATMFGLRITSLPKTEQALRIGQLLEKTQDIKAESDFLKVAAGVFPEFPLFPGAPKAMNIGIVAQWFSIGEEMIWSPQMDKPLSFEELNAKAPKFFDTTLNPAAIEFWYPQPTGHWYKIYVSDAQDDGYRISHEKYNKALNRLAGFKP